MDNPYKVLLLPEDSPPSMVNYAYRLLAGRWHPDKNPDDRQEATRRMKEINEAYQAIKKSSSTDPRWNFLDYEFQPVRGDIGGDFLGHNLSEILGYRSSARLDCPNAEIRSVKRPIGHVEIDLSDISTFGDSDASSRRGNFYLWADPRSGFQTDIKMELEDILIAAAREKGRRIHPLYVRPTFRWYNIETFMEPRIGEFCDVLSQPDAESKKMIDHFRIGSVLPRGDPYGEEKTLEKFELQLDHWVYTRGITETPDGGLRISYRVSDEDTEDDPLRTVELTRKDYMFIQVLVFGGKLLES